jgi:energy-coupling factor transport system ATP-binding protein
MQGVTAGYGRQSILHDIDLTIAQDDFVGILGHNGAGKTTLALVMAGLLQPRKGKVYFANGHNPRAGEDVSLLFQNPTDQLFTDSVAEEVAFGSLNFGHYNAAEQERLLTDMGLWPLRKRMPTALSIGQQQRTALCACMALRTRLLILDEPTIGQDWTHLLAIMKSVKQLHNAGTAVILITHDIELIDIYANRRIELKHGRIYSDEPIIGENCCI